jgi:hypothetical protein
MTILKIENFTGIMPRWSARLLPPNAATTAANAKLLSGELRGFHETQLLFDFNPSIPAHPILRAFRLPQSVNAPIPIGGADTWLGFFDANVDFVRTPVLQDSFERYYWTGDSFNLGGAPQYNTRARINAGNTGGNAPFLLGIPAPVNQISVTPPPGVATTRSYTYTFVSAYGEEGPPGAATVATGQNGTWVLGNFDTAVPANTNVTTIRIYRTVTGNTTNQYFHVADIAIGTTTYNDNNTDVTVANNFTMQSLTWTGPPTTLQGLVAHPGGFLVGFSGRDLWMSQPFQPHAWPVQYIQTCQTEIVGLAVYQNCILVMTTSHPYFAEGMNPLNITLQKLDSVDPCVSRRSIVTTISGVYYASPQGIILNTGGQTQLVTRQLFTREEWQNLFSPTTVYAVPYGVEYIGFSTTSTGFIFSPTDSSTPLTQLDRFSNVTAIQQDAYSGDVYLLQSNQVRLWDPPASIPYTYTWQSKQFDLMKPVNFGAFRLKFQPSTITISASQLSDYTNYNGRRILKKLSPIDSFPINGVRTLAQPAFPPISGYIPPPEIRNPLGGSELYNLGQYSNSAGGVNVLIQARDLTSTWYTLFQYTISTEQIIRLPSGFKSDAWQVRLVGNVPVYSFTMAETADELRRDMVQPTQT